MPGLASNAEGQTYKTAAGWVAMIEYGQEYIETGPYREKRQAKARGENLVARAYSVRGVRWV